MKISNIFKFCYVLICSAILISVSSISKGEMEVITSINQKTNQKSTVSLETYYLIEKYSKIYSIPKYIAYNIAFLETRYKGPFDRFYDPFLTSSSGAVGPMQIMISTANYINFSNTSSSSLKNNLELNISTSMKLLNRLYGQYRDWGVVCGYYNTGQPIINEYASFCVSNKKYIKNWNSYE